MGARGRKPAAELAIASQNVEKMDQRPEPPGELTPEQVQIWHQTVNSLQADWFRGETLALLTQYCRHVVEARYLGEFIEQMRGNGETFDLREYAAMLRARKGETDAIATLATKLRITPQSTTSHAAVKRGGAKSRPWDSSAG